VPHSTGNTHTEPRIHRPVTLNSHNKQTKNADKPAIIALQQSE
jgi:hypothetical protein